MGEYPCNVSLPSAIYIALSITSSAREKLSPLIKYQFRIYWKGFLKKRYNELTAIGSGNNFLCCLTAKLIFNETVLNGIWW